MKLKTAIIDDEAPSRRRMKKLIASEPDCICIGEAENGQDAIKLIQSQKPDLLLLDIQLKDMTGFEVLDEVGHFYNNKVIFITAYDQYAIKAFEANALDYLLKPFKKERFSESISRAIRQTRSDHFPLWSDLARVLKENQNLLKIKEGKTIHHVRVIDLIYIRAEGYYCHFIQENKVSKLIRISLKETEQTLPPQFIRISRSLIINRKKISWIRDLSKTIEIEMTNGTHFTANKDYSEKVRALSV